MEGGSQVHPMSKFGLVHQPKLLYLWLAYGARGSEGKQLAFLEGEVSTGIISASRLRDFLLFF